MTKVRKAQQGAGGKEIIRDGKIENWNLIILSGLKKFGNTRRERV